MKGRDSVRSVPLSPLLGKTLQEWFEHHPGGEYTFAFEAHNHRSSKTRSENTPISPDEATDHFDTTVSGSEWQQLRGWHVLRHSFISISASAGIDERTLMSWVGHLDRSTQDRYRHLIPSSMKAEHAKMFG